jgi:hypothetical protein
MLWIEYESSESVPKEVIGEVIKNIQRLMYRTPVAAEDQNPNGFGIFAYDGYDTWNDGENDDPPPDVSEITLERLIVTFESSKLGQTDVADICVLESSSNNCDHREAISHSPGTETGHVVSSNGFDSTSSTDGFSPPQTSDGDNNSQNLNSSRDTSTGGSARAGIATDATSGSINPPPAKEHAPTFTGNLTIKTPKGYFQRLTVQFQPTIITEVVGDSILNTLTMSSVSVNVTNMTGPRDEKGNPEMHHLPAYFVTKRTNITVGAWRDNDTPYFPRDKTPIADDFVGSRESSRGTTLGGTLQAGYPLIINASLAYTINSSSKETLSARTTGITPQFTIAPDADQTNWIYDVRENYQNDLQFSEDHPPMHAAKFRYCQTQVPEHLITSVQAHFGKNGKIRYKIADLGCKDDWRPFIKAAYIRDISITLAACIKLIKPLDYFKTPAEGRKDVTLNAEVTFNQKTQAGDLKKQAKNMGENTELQPSAVFK